MKLVRHKTHTNMYYLKWKDGTLSEDFYNLTRAKEYIRIDGIKELGIGQLYNASPWG